MTTIIQSIEEIIAQYHLVLIDQWGVLHNGGDELGEAKKALHKIKSSKHNPCTIILSNSGKRASSTRDLLSSMQFNMQHIDHILTSGEAAFIYLKKEHDGALKNKRKCLFFSWDQDRKLLKDLPYEETNDVYEADFIIAAGVERGKAENYREDLKIAAKRNLSLLCTNPDLVAANPDGSLKDCPGKIAKIYQEIGGDVIAFGKPKPEIYQMALYLSQEDRYINVEPKNVLCIGDSLMHDIAGGNGQNFDTLFITTGIHGAEKKQWGNKIFDMYNTQPTYEMHYFK